MGDNSRESITPWTFLSHPDAKELFARLDYALKDGVHIQRVEKQITLFRFLEETIESLRLYYLDYYGVHLEKGGEGTEAYYYLDFVAGTRGNIHADHRYFLANEFVIIGFLIYKIVFIDAYLELDSVKRLQKMIKQDYEELKPGVYRALAKIQREKMSQMDDEKLDKIVGDALVEFNKIGWITLEGDKFETLPSFHRLVKMYSDYINTLDEWLKKE